MNAPKLGLRQNALQEEADLRMSKHTVEKKKKKNTFNKNHNHGCNGTGPEAGIYTSWVEEPTRNLGRRLPGPRRRRTKLRSCGTDQVVDKTAADVDVVQQEQHQGGDTLSECLVLEERLQKIPGTSATAQQRAGLDQLRH